MWRAAMADILPGALLRPCFHLGPCPKNIGGLKFTIVTVATRLDRMAKWK
jgi:hypothetical protein